ncbi:MAG: hypothetical protein AAF385_07390 [Pseudomonadota bacterium]
MKLSSYLVLILLSAVLAAAWWLRHTSENRVVATIDRNSETPVVQSAPQNPVERPAITSGEQTSDTQQSEAAKQDCEKSSLEKYGEKHPIMLDELERLAPVLVAGPALEAYRHQSSDQLLQLANSGDSMAMAVLGALEYMKVNDRGDANAVDLLESFELFGGSYVPPSQQTEEDKDALDRAAFWFEESALHGRVGALNFYSQALFQRFGGALELGWISAEQLKQNPDLENLAHPMNVFISVAHAAEPELQRGLSGMAYDRMKPLLGLTEKHPVMHAIVAEQTRLFVAARDERGLEPVTLAPSRYTEAEIREALCEDGTP